MNTSDDGKRGDSWWVEALNLIDTDLLHTYYCACIDLNRQFPFALSYQGGNNDDETQTDASCCCFFVCSHRQVCLPDDVTTVHS